MTGITERYCMSVRHLYWKLEEACAKLFSEGGIYHRRVHTVVRNKAKICPVDSKIVQQDKLINACINILDAEL